MSNHFRSDGAAPEFTFIQLEGTDVLITAAEMDAFEGMSTTFVRIWGSRYRTTHANAILATYEPLKGNYLDRGSIEQKKAELTDLMLDRDTNIPDDAQSGEWKEGMDRLMTELVMLMVPNPEMVRKLVTNANFMLEYTDFGNRDIQPESRETADSKHDWQTRMFATYILLTRYCGLVHDAYTGFAPLFSSSSPTLSNDTSSTLMNWEELSAAIAHIDLTPFHACQDYEEVEGFSDILPVIALIGKLEAYDFSIGVRALNLQNCENGTLGRRVYNAARFLEIHTLDIKQEMRLSGCVSRPARLQGHLVGFN